MAAGDEGDNNINRQLAQAPRHASCKPAILLLSYFMAQSRDSALNDNALTFDYSTIQRMTQVNRCDLFECLRDSRQLIGPTLAFFV